MQLKDTSSKCSQLFRYVNEGFENVESKKVIEVAESKDSEGQKIAINDRKGTAN